MRSPFAYVPRAWPLQAASPGAAVAYLGALTATAFLYSNPIVLAATGTALLAAGLLAGARTAVRAALLMGLTLALLIVVVNAIVVSRGETVLARLGEWPLFGQVDVTLEAIAAGAVLGLRAAVVMIAFCVYSACVDPDRVLRALRPLARRSALTATLVSRLVPVAAADAARLRDAACLRGPAAAAVGRAPLARRLLAGSLDRAVDVAATLELRGYSLEPPSAPGGATSFGAAGSGKRFTRRRSASATAGVTRSGPMSSTKRYVRGWRRVRDRVGATRSRYDRRFVLAGGGVLVVAIAGKALGADAWSEYPAVEVGTGPATLAVAAAVALSGLAPLRRRPKVRRAVPRPKARTASTSLSAGWRS